MTHPLKQGSAVVGEHTFTAHSDDEATWWVTADHLVDEEWLLVPRPGQHNHLVVRAVWDGRGWAYTVVDTAPCDGDAEDVAQFLGDYSLLAHPSPTAAPFRPAVPRRWSVSEAQRLAELVLSFGQVHRSTVHPDGTPESDTTHTVMLALFALRAHCLFAGDLDLAELLSMSLVHDLVEVYAGDVNTVRALDASARQDKAAREAAALAQIQRELPWLGACIARYEDRDTPEAVLVWALDKVLPRLVHNASGCRALLEDGLTERELAERALYRAREMCEAGVPTAAVELFLEASVHQSSALHDASIEQPARSCGRHEVQVGAAALASVPDLGGPDEQCC